MTTRLEIVAEARRWLNTRWLHQGRVLGVGIDCIGLVHEVGKAVGLVRDVVIPADYGPTPANGLMRRLCEQHLIRAYEPELGRIALMRFDVEPQHMGIIGDHPNGFSLIHSYAKARKTVEHRLDDMWKVVAYYDFPGIQ